MTAPAHSIEVASPIVGELAYASLSDHPCRVYFYPGAGEATTMACRCGSKSTPAANGWTDEAQIIRSNDGRRCRNARRYAVEFQLVVSAVFTYETAPSVAAAVEDCRHMVRSLRRRYAAGPFPYLRAVHLGEKRGRVHVHLMVPEFLAGALPEVWNHGDTFVEVLPDVEAVRACAQYLARPQMNAPDSKRLVQVARGFEVQRIEVDVPSIGAGVEECIATMAQRFPTSTSRLPLGGWVLFWDFRNPADVGS